MPKEDLNRLIGRATLDPDFKEKLLNQDTRLEAINDFQEGREEKVIHSGTEPKKGKLTPQEISSLMKIEASDLQKLAKGIQDIIDSEKR
jgi:hypothetical protein